MNNKFTPSKVDVVKKLDSKDFEVLETKSSGKEIAGTLSVELVKTLLPIASESFKKKIELDQETQKLVRDDKRNILNTNAEMLRIQIEKEEAKADYNQERINRWREEIEVIVRKLDIMDAKSEGFLKGMISFLNVRKKN